MSAVKTLIVADLTGFGGVAETVGDLLQHLTSLQGPSGLFDGDNLVSPPDSAFTINDVCLVLEILERSERWTDEATVLKTIAERSLDAMITGGVHTPNHRWELAGALAGLRRVTGDERLLPRIDEWLAEGIDIDADGFFSERSAVYGSIVTGPALVHLARLLEWPALLVPVRAHLRTLVSLVDDDGEVTTVHSRRQDQRETYHAHRYLSLLRRFAITDGDTQFARLATIAAAGGPPEAARHLAEALVDPVLTEPLPVAAPAPEGRTVWPTVGLARRRSGATTSTVFAGADTRSTGSIGSGLANSANVFQFRHGAARLRSLRISPAFFGMGAFRPTTLQVDGDGAVLLTEERVSGYYQPLAGSATRPDGAYPLTHDGRFWASMDFPARTLSPMRLVTTLRITESGDTAELELRMDGPRTRVGVELVFGDGELIAPCVLRAGDAVLTVETEGCDDELPPRFDDGELFTYVHGDDRIEGQRVVLGAWSDRVVRLRVSARGGA